METIDYFLRRYREDPIKRRGAADRIKAELAAYERQLRSDMSLEPAMAGD